MLNEVGFGEPNGEEISDDQPPRTYACFAYTLINRAMDRRGIKPRRPLPTVGHYVDANEDAKFLRLHHEPESDAPATVRRWVESMAAILRKPERYELYPDILSAMVPIEEPLRYKDSEINAVLRETMLRGAASAKREEAAQEAATQVDSTALDSPDLAKVRAAEDAQRVKRENTRAEEKAATFTRMAADSAAEMLGLRDCVDTFPELLERTKRGSRDRGLLLGGGNALSGAAALAGKHPEFRSALIEYLKPQLASPRASTYGPSAIFDAAWRGDLRELAPLLEKVATNSPAEAEDPSASTYPPASGNGKFHAARVILMAWRETDLLTKTKLDAMLNGYIGGGDAIPEVLRAEFDALPKKDQFAFRDFVTWMRTVEVPWSRRLLEDVFTPHTPRPDIAFER